METPKKRMHNVLLYIFLFPISIIRGHIFIFVIIIIFLDKSQMIHYLKLDNML